MRSSSRTLYLRHGQIWMSFLPALAMGVELLAEEADSLSLWLGGVGKREGLEAAGLVVARVVPVSEPSARGERPCYMDAAGQNAQNECVTGSDVNEHVVWKDDRVEEHEEAVFGGFDGRKVATKALQSGAKVGAWLAMNPPVGAI